MTPVSYTCKINFSWHVWLKECVGHCPNDWTFGGFGGHYVIWFARAEDAAAFKLKFEL